jgi:carbonic anhydrase
MIFKKRRVLSAIYLLLSYLWPGPEKWCAKYPQAGGHSQSPIDVRPAQAAYDAKLNENPLKFSFSNDCFKNVLNSGSSFKVSGSDNAQSSELNVFISLYRYFLKSYLF